MRSSRVRGLMGLCACAVLLAGCGTKQPVAGSSVPPYTAQPSTSASASASPTASASASASTGEVPFTAEDLSDLANDFQVTAVPQGLDATSQQVVRSYITFQREGWKLSSGKSKDRSSYLANTSGKELQKGDAFRARLDSKGWHLGGRYSTKVMSVYSSSGITATVEACQDQRQISYLDAGGTDVTEDGSRHAFHKVYVLERSETGWQVTEGQISGTDDCTD
ncbi:Uncharacterised protein [Actinomyces bovis]|uniref:Lipoprotein n=1 Tax=Actinomyces bovis TaxID=1658 RepID=A0ABY1VMD5_9ACTO|nr:Uncharacterised protein [Actinomyces bovis]VEG52356.1 Uncharacterised protein [Actinomyces israelii]